MHKKFARFGGKLLCGFILFVVCLGWLFCWRCGWNREGLGLFEWRFGNFWDDLEVCMSLGKFRSYVEVW